MKEKIKIASGQGFWGDLIDAPIHQVTKGNIDYLVMDYLAEVTMSILQKQKDRNPLLGYAKDIPPLMEKILPVCKEKNIKIITNGGGVNPSQCAKEILKIADKLNIKIKIGIVSGDDIKEEIDSLLGRDERLNNMETGQSIDIIKDKILSANIYFGAKPIVEALQKNVDIVITGRTTDTGLTLAPMIYEYNWNFEDYNLISAGTIAGHIIECGAQSSGGNFLGDWENIRFEDIGFPIIEAYHDGTFTVTKHENTGGKISLDTVAEQLVYEIGDPKNYITPDCIADFTSIHLDDLGNDRVIVSGIKGSAPTEFYKVSCAYSSGYTSFGTLTYSWPSALKKARMASEILVKRLKNAGVKYSDINFEYIGYNACHGPLAKEHSEDDINEIMLRVGIKSDDYGSLERFGKEIAPLILTGPPAVTGFSGGRPKPQEVAAYWPALIKKNLFSPKIDLLEN